MTQETEYMSNYMSQLEYLETAIFDSTIECPVCGSNLEPDCPKCGECGLVNDLASLI